MDCPRQNDTGFYRPRKPYESALYRQFVWTMPKRFRLYFRFDRDLLRKLHNLAWETTLEVYRAVLGRDAEHSRTTGGFCPDSAPFAFFSPPSTP